MPMESFVHYCIEDVRRMKVSLAEVSKNVPNLIAIELPCFVRDPQAALTMLGGNEHIERNLSLDDSASIECRLPGNNPLRPNLVSLAQDKRQLVIKIRRKKVIRNGTILSSSVVDLTIVGIVRKTITFPNPADFQFLPAYNFAESYKPENRSVSLPLEIVSQSIGRIDYEKRTQYLSFLYVSKRFKKSAASVKKLTSDAADEQQRNELGENSDEDKQNDRDQPDSDDNEDRTKPSLAGKKRNPDAGYTQILKFGDSIPLAHPLGKYPPRWIAKRDKTGEIFRGIEFIDRLFQMFEKIPVLKRSQIIELLDLGPRQHLFKECLPYAAYTYSNGPFSNLWIRFGYDPSFHPSSRIYQLLNCRFPPQYLMTLSDSLADHIGREKINRKMVDLDRMEIIDAPEEFSHRFIDKGAFARLPMSIFGYVCKHQISFQIHTLSDKQLFSFVQQLQVTNVCTEQTGWFTDEALVLFRNFICKVIEQRIDTFLQSPIVFAPKSSPSTGAKSEDQHIVKARLQLFLEDFESISQVDDSWVLSQDQYPTDVDSSPLPEVTPIRHMLFWLRKYGVAANQNLESIEHLLLSTRMPNRIVVGSGTSSGTSQDWSSTNRASGGWYDLNDKLRDQTAILTSSAAAVAVNNTNALGPLFASTNSQANAPASSQSNQKRNVRFAPHLEQQPPSNAALASTNFSSSLQFSLTSDSVVNAEGFQMLMDSDSEED